MPNNSATLTVTPSNPTVGQIVSFSGCGYVPNQSLLISVHTTKITNIISGFTTDAEGCFASGEVWAAPVAGRYTAYADQGNDARGKAVFEVAT